MLDVSVPALECGLIAARMSLFRIELTRNFVPRENHDAVPTKTKKLAKTGSLKIGNQWNAINIIAQSQTAPH